MKGAMALAARDKSSVLIVAVDHGGATGSQWVRFIRRTLSAGRVVVDCTGFWAIVKRPCMLGRAMSVLGDGLIGRLTAQGHSHRLARGVDVTKDALRNLSSGLVIAGQGDQPAHTSLLKLPIGLKLNCGP
jgi:hypothetical protein